MNDDTTPIPEAPGATAAPSSGDNEESVLEPGWRRALRRVDSRWAIGALLLVLVLASTVLIPLLTTTSKAVREASSAPPATTLTEPVEKRTLSAQVVTRGSVVTHDEVGITCTPAAPATGGAGGATVFTRTPTMGDRIGDGAVVAAVNGRPVIAMTGAVAAFRDLVPGATGTDVRQLQAALIRIGHRITDRSGTYGPSTQRAVDKVYAKAGFTPFGPTDEERTRLRAAQDDVRSADTEVNRARAALSAAKAGPSREEVLRARIAAADAAKALAEGPKTGPQHDLLALQLAQAREHVAALRRAPDTRNERAALTAATTRRAEAAAERDRIAAGVGTHVPYCEIVFVPSLPATVVAAHSTPDGSAAAAGAAAAGGDTPQEGVQAAGGAGAGWATLAPGTLTIEAGVSAQDAKLLHRGDAVKFADDGGGTSGVGTITAIRATGADTVLDITPARPLPADRRGSDLRVTVATSTTKGAVLVVPTAAVKGRADGGARVTVLDAGGERRDVPVDAGLSADGFVEITPTDPAHPLTVGDRVVVSQ
ncbi:hypothetical protein [Gephyromycinifex aptenodytis]|uniref:hypothetical protein n=1 Tax=Gephyromycinifex aptenodytis TaxID=2716227 RepID=UPI001447CED2|nr:hypothetical protein [Gephyromycinifex aptenodytis]